MNLVWEGAFGVQNNIFFNLEHIWTIMCGSDRQCRCIIFTDGRGVFFPANAIQNGNGSGAVIGNLNNTFDNILPKSFFSNGY